MSGSTKIAEARISLLIRGEALDFDAIEAVLGLQATAVRRKGDLINRLPEIIADEDEWVYSIELYHPDGEDASLNAMLENLLVLALVFRDGVVNSFCKYVADRFRKVESCLVDFR